MTNADWTVLVLYLGGTLLAGVLIGKMVKNTRDMFSAGGQSPWWMSGLSAFMTMFSANTFVVWGGIAYEHGLVAVMINLCYGVAALLVGFTVAGKWNKLGIKTPSEYIVLRFGKAALHFYTWFMMVFRIVGTGGALYAIAFLTLSVVGGTSEAGVPLSLGTLNTAIILFALLIIVYTMVGGLWAVLMTDTLQFIILNIAVLFVVPLLIFDVGGFRYFLEKAPEGFFDFTTSRYAWYFLVGWVVIHYFMIGAEWAFVQRHICVRTPEDARKGAYLFGGLYLLSPFIWLLPPLLWRVKNPIPENADPEMIRQLSESAYILSCKSVLPSGMLGLMLAAMFSATASMISSQLNVFSGALTNDIYRPYCKRPNDEGHLVVVGRVFTMVLGMIMAGIALLTPVLGGAAKMIIGVTEVMVVPLMAPSLAGLLFRKLDTSAIWITVGVCFPLGLMVKFTNYLEGTWFENSIMTGVVLPVLITGLLLLRPQKAIHSEWETFQTKEYAVSEVGSPQSNRLPFQITGISLMVCGLTIMSLLLVNTEHRNALMLTGSLCALFGLLMIKKR